MKKFALLGLALLLTACVSLEDVSTDFTTKWVGRSYDEFVMEYGVPKSSQKLQNGMTMYLVEQFATIGHQYGISGITCALNVLVDANNQIKSVRASGDPRACDVDRSKRVIM